MSRTVLITSKKRSTARPGSYFRSLAAGDTAQRPLAPILPLGRDGCNTIRIKKDRKANMNIDYLGTRISCKEQPPWISPDTSDRLRRLVHCKCETWTWTPRHKRLCIETTPPMLAIHQRCLQPGCKTKQMWTRQQLYIFKLWSDLLESLFNLNVCNVEM